VVVGDPSRTLKIPRLPGVGPRLHTEIREESVVTTPKRKTEQRQGAGGRAAHDVGGLDFGAIDRNDHDLALWERRVDAMMIRLYAGKKAFTVDAMRRAIEDYGQQAYDRTTYYEKWVRAMRNLIVEQEVATREEVDTKMAEVRARHRKAGRKVSDETVPW
jgi:Nitrile hydratase beta subunit